MTLNVARLKKSPIFIYIPISSTFSHDNNSNKRLYICISLSFISSIRRTESMRSRPIIICEGQNVSCSSTDRNSPTQSHPTLEYLHCTGLQPKQQDWVWIRQKQRRTNLTVVRSQNPPNFMHQEERHRGRYKEHSRQTTPFIKVLTRSISGIISDDYICLQNPHPHISYP